MKTKGEEAIEARQSRANIARAWRPFEPCLENVEKAEDNWVLNGIAPEGYYMVIPDFDAREMQIHAASASWATARMLEVKGQSLPKEKK